MKRITAILTAAMTVLSCGKPELKVTDSSFEFSSRVEFSTETLRARLTLSKAKGADREYTVTCSIDGDPTLLLEDASGNSLPSRFTADFSQTPAMAWTLPRLASGGHVMDITIQAGEITQELHEAFSIDVDSFKVHAEVKAAAGDDRSVLMVSLTEGVRDRTYSGTVSVDGVEVSSCAFSGNFGSSPVIMVPLPLLRPGRHEVSVLLTDGITEESAAIPFDEPLRYDTIEISLSHNIGSGKTMMTVGPNPYGLSFRVRDSLVVKGACDYHRATSTEGHTATYHEEKTLTDVVAISPLAASEGTKYMLADREGTMAAIETLTMENTTWKEEWRSDGEGYWSYVVTGDGVSHFRVTETTDHITAEIEKVQGITAVVHCDGDGYTWNGITLGDGYSYRL